jgi:hypothetical protein
VPARGEESKPGNAAALTIEEAIDTAKHCVLERNIQVAGSFIESAHFERNARGDRGPYWTVSWAHSREVKGGRVWITVYQNRTCEVRFGE